MMIEGGCLKLSMVTLKLWIYGQLEESCSIGTDQHFAPRTLALTLEIF